MASTEMDDLGTTHFMRGERPRRTFEDPLLNQLRAQTERRFLSSRSEPLVKPKPRLGTAFLEPKLFQPQRPVDDPQSFIANQQPTPEISNRLDATKKAQQGDAINPFRKPFSKIAPKSEPSDSDLKFKFPGEDSLTRGLSFGLGSGVAHAGFRTVDKIVDAVANASTKQQKAPDPKQFESINQMGQFRRFS